MTSEMFWGTLFILTTIIFSVWLIGWIKSWKDGE